MGPWWRGGRALRGGVPGVVTGDVRVQDDPAGALGGEGRACRFRLGFNLICWDDLVHVRQGRNGSDYLADVAWAILRASMRRGSMDNMTAIVIEICPGELGGAGFAKMQ
jgi:hypothetical protein